MGVLLCHTLLANEGQHLLPFESEARCVPFPLCMSFSLSLVASVSLGKYSTILL